jgi:hypothetical protein
MERSSYLHFGSWHFQGGSYSGGKIVDLWVILLVCLRTSYITWCHHQTITWIENESNLILHIHTYYAISNIYIYRRDPFHMKLT